MPHKAARLMSALNGVTSDPGFLRQNSVAIRDATSMSALVEVLGLSGNSPVVDAAAEVDVFLPPAILDAVLAGYRGAAAQGTDAVYVNWKRGAGFSVALSQDPGTDAVEDIGVVSIQVASPRLTPEG